MENYQFDEKIMNQGWSQMNDLLDKEMPVQKKRRTLLFWWWSAASLSVAAMLLLFFKTPNFSNKNENNVIANHIETKKGEEISRQILDSEKQPLSDNSLSFNKKDIDFSKTRLSAQSSKNIYSKQNTENQFVINEINENNAPINEEQNINSTGSINQEKQKVETKRLSEQREKTNIASLGLLDKKITPIDIKGQEKNVFLEKSIKKINYLQANNLKIGIFASATNGWNIGATLKKTWKKHSLSANLFGEYSSKNLGIYRSAVPVIVDSMATYPVVFPYGNINLAKDNGGNYKTNLVSDYYFSLKTRNLCIGIEHNYRFRSRWESILGFEYLREVGLRSYSFAQVKNSNSFLSSKDYGTAEVNTIAFSPTKNTSSLNYFADAIQSQDELQNINVNKNVFYVTTGFSYYFGKNLKLSAIYKQGLNSTIVITPIKVMVTNNPIALRMTYYLPLKK